MNNSDSLIKKKGFFFFFTLAWLNFFIISAAFAVSVSPRVNSSKEDKAHSKENAVMNFDADVIEGEKKRPALFFQAEVDNISFDTLIYLRKDFNDFHFVERMRKPRIIKVIER